MTAQHLALRIRRAVAREERHLVLSLLLRPRSVVVTSVAVAAGAPPELLSTGHTWLAAVTRGDVVTHLSRVPDPFESRGVRREQGAARPWAEGVEGRAVVAVPFASLQDLARSRVHVLSLGPERRHTQREGLLGELAQRIETGSGLRTVDFEDITASPRWSAVAALLGMDPAGGPR